jgi:hypothetical protein
MAVILYHSAEQWEQLMGMLNGEVGIVIVSPEAHQELRDRLGHEPPDKLDDYDWSDADLWIDWVCGPMGYGFGQLLGAEEYQDLDEEDE